jgi:hypothetical protein
MKSPDVLTLIAEADGHVRIRIHRPPEFGYSAEPGLQALQNLMPALRRFAAQTRKGTARA